MLTGFLELSTTEQIQHMCFKFNPEEFISCSLLRDQFRNKKPLTGLRDPAQNIGEALLTLRENGVTKETPGKGNEKYKVPQGSCQRVVEESSSVATR